MSIVETLTLPVGQTPDGEGWTIETGNTLMSRWMRPLHFTVARRQPEWFTSDSKRTVATMDRAGMQRIAEEHEWLRDRVARLESDNARLRATGLLIVARPVECHEAATAD